MHTWTWRKYTPLLSARDLLRLPFPPLAFHPLLTTFHSFPVADHPTLTSHLRAPVTFSSPLAFQPAHLFSFHSRHLSSPFHSSRVVFHPPLASLLHALLSLPYLVSCFCRLSTHQRTSPPHCASLMHGMASSGRLICIPSSPPSEGGGKAKRRSRGGEERPCCCPLTQSPHSPSHHTSSPTHCSSHHSLPVDKLPPLAFPRTTSHSFIPTRSSPRWPHVARG